MKIILILFRLVALQTVAFGQLAGATNPLPSDAEIRRLIVGTWGGDRNDRHARATYAANGTAVSTNWVTGKQILNAVPYTESTWEVREGLLISKVTKTTDARLCPLGSVWRTRVVLINQTEAVGVTQVGTTNRIARIK